MAIHRPMQTPNTSRGGRWSRPVAATAAVAVLGISLTPLMQASAIVEPGLTGLVEQTATESIVLLKNQNNVLPLTPSRVLSVFGRVQVDYFPVGFGSGGDVKYQYATDPLTALRRNPGITVNEDLAGL
jgi:beta-glucosidase